MKSSFVFCSFYIHQYCHRHILICSVFVFNHCIVLIVSSLNHRVASHAVVVQIASGALAIANCCQLRRQFIVWLETDTRAILIPFFTRFLSPKTGSDVLICAASSGSAGRGWSDGFLTRHDFDRLTQAFEQLKQSHGQIPEHLRLLPRRVCRRWQTKCLTTSR